MKSGDIIKDIIGELYKIDTIDEERNRVYLYSVENGVLQPGRIGVPLSLVMKTCTVVEASDETN